MFPASLAEQFIPLLIRVLRQLDPQCLSALEKHHNKIFCLQIEHCPSLYFQTTAQGFIPLKTTAQCNTTFSGSLGALITSLFSKQRNHTGLYIKGDLEYAKALYECWQYLDIDWEAHLAKGLGDNIAHLAMQVAKGSKQWTSELWQNRTQDLSAYLQDETNLLPTPAEVNAFYQEVDLLRHEVDLFEAKLTLLQRSMTKK